MKTLTKSKIIEQIGKRGSMRPVELAAELQITPQALHRHLRSMVLDGTLEVRGSPPSTFYFIAGNPDLSKAIQWIKTGGVVADSEIYLCQSRDVFAARLGRLQAYEKQGLRPGDLPLVISMAGEIGNNSFDHNIGQWRDIPGCWFESQATRSRLWICIADRGQGIFNSLIRVSPKIVGDQEALETAFEKHISGRAPEQRGNGLKFVKSVIGNQQNRGVACLSGRGRIHFGNLGEQCMKALASDLRKVDGTITLIAWELSK